ncbi:MAG TPA: HU family DNA-binding protein [Paludibacter sp.]|nr:HU family DNA-binding protein [Paludibacter sp.]
MIKEKISSQEIIDLVSSKSKVSKRVAEDFLKVMISSIEEALLAGEVVKIKNFGTFKLQWNEPRKSVNVHSGEDILLAGYHKVTFTPDVILKDLVNEPFAHLTPVELDSENPEPIQEKTDVALDPLRIFSDQASEIKDLLSEIQALSPSFKSKVVEEKPEAVLEVEPLAEGEDNDEDFPEEEVEEELPEEVVEQMEEGYEPAQEKAVEPVQELKVAKTALSELIGRVQEEKGQEAIQEENVVKSSVESVIYQHEEKITPGQEEPKQVVEPIPQFDSSEFLKDINPGKKRKVWLLVLVISVLFLGTGSGLYFFCPPVTEFTVTAVNSCVESVIKVSGVISGWFQSKPKSKPAPVKQTIIIPKDTIDNDTVAVQEPVDSLQLMFDNPRVYTKFIATETVEQGNRLTIMSKKYYGSKDFWVYIYEANKEKIPNPDIISEGTLIRIPKLDPRLIDIKNPRCIEKAKELHDVYVRKVK